MAKVQLEVEIKGGDTVEKASGKVESLRSQLRKLKDQLASGQLSGEEFARISQQAGQLDDKLKDVSKRVANLGSDTKYLDGFIGVTQGIIGGFTAAQGAMALFGEENEDIQKTLVKVQGAVALLNGFQAVANTLQKESAAMTALSAARYKALTFVKQRYAAVVGQTTGALKLLRIAGAALGIGLIVTAVGALVNNFDKLKKVVLNFLPSLESLGKWFTYAKNAVTDFLGLTSDATREADKLGQASEKLMQKQKNEIEIMKAAGKSRKEIYLAEYKMMTDRINALDKMAALNKERTQEEIEERADLIQQLKVLNATYRREENEEQAKQDKKNRDAAEKSAKERAKDIKKWGEESNKEAIKRLEEQRDRDSQQKKYQEEQDEINAQYEEALLKREIQQYEDRKKAEADADQKLQDAKRAALETGLNIAQEFAGKNKVLADTLFAIQKGVAIAQVIVDTQKEIAGIASNPVLTALPDAGVTAKAGLIAAAKIRAATSIATIAATTIGRFAGGGGRGATGGGGGGGTPTRSQQPNVPTFTTNNNRQQTGGTERIKVYVTETDIRNVSNRTSSIYSQAQVE